MYHFVICEFQEMKKKRRNSMESERKSISRGRHYKRQLFHTYRLIDLVFAFMWEKSSIWYLMFIPLFYLDVDLYFILIRIFCNLMSDFNFFFILEKIPRD